MAGIVDLEAIGEIYEYPELAAALEELGRALQEVERVGYRLGFDWYEQREVPGDQPSSAASHLMKWVQKVRNS